jgi:acetate kinase
MRQQQRGASILVINCGSSSLKYEVYDMPSRDSLARGGIERIGEKNGKITQVSINGKYARDDIIPDHERAMELMVAALLDEHNGVVDSIDEIKGVGHRVVHGGENYSESVIIDDEVVAAI